MVAAVEAAVRAPHALVLPFPAQSHIMSLLELSHGLLERGIKITFLNTKFNHCRLLSALPHEQAAAAATGRMADGIRLAAIPDGLMPSEDRNDLGRLTESMMAIIPGLLEEFIARNAKGDDEERFTWFVADESMAWLLEVAKKAGLRSAVYFPAAAAVLAGGLSIPKLIQDGVIDQKGAPKDHKMFQLSPEMPPMDPTHLAWNCFNDPKTKRLMFDLISKNNETVPNAELILCNTFHELEKSVFSYAPNILPVGPRIAGSRPGKTFGNFWVQETGCIEWLDKQRKNSVIYIAFGSFTIFNQHQFQELALALELIGRPFLWVVRSDLTNVNDEQRLLNISSIIERVGDRGKIVSWCPQQQVLAHPSVACFVSHCGWNSTLEGVRYGVPFLCWPYFADQFFNQTYIHDVWRVGLKMTKDENEIYSHEEIRSKLEELVNDEKIKGRSLLLKEMACKSLEIGGSSFDNFNNFVDLLKGV